MGLKSILTKPYKWFLPYLGAAPDILRYQVLSKAVLWILVSALGFLGHWAVISTGHVAVSSGDYKFFLTSWQGWVVIIAALVVLALYALIDVGTRINFAGIAMSGERDSAWNSLKRSLLSAKMFLAPQGIGLIVYLAIAVPIAGIGWSISLTSNLHIPSFITSVISSTPLYSALYFAAVVAIILFGFAHFFVFHEMLLSRVPANRALKSSRAIMRANWRDFIRRMLVFVIQLGIACFCVSFVVAFIPIFIVEAFPLPLVVSRFLSLFGMQISVAVSAVLVLVSTYAVAIKATELYYRYTSDPEACFKPFPKRRHHWMRAVTVVVVVVSLATSIGAAAYFDEVFPNEVNVGIVAHRAGGNEAPENSVAGVAKAAELGAWGSEIDIQRTADGFYVVNHDATFERVAGDPRRPDEMTLAQVKELTIGDSGQPVPTYEEMLDAANGQLTLLVELKGDSADQQMADDAVRIAQERGMLDQVVFISLDYNLIDYLETTYPQAETGYLTFLSFGQTENLNCDYLGLEAETATRSLVSSIHEEGKKVLVWTVNDPGEQRRFLDGEVDGIITDNVLQADEVIGQLLDRDDLTLIIETWLPDA